MISRSGIFIAAFLLQSVLTLSQTSVKDVPRGWHLQDLKQDGVYGIGAENAYQTILKNKKPKQIVIVAVIDSGIDTSHEDLKPVLWTNPKEIPGNGIDDDHNGYMDGISWVIRMAGMYLKIVMRQPAYIIHSEGNMRIKYLIQPTWVLINWQN
jgi:hypothetical protein